MAIDSTDTIDGMAIDQSRKAICLLIADHLKWKGFRALKEYEHLRLLQNKINAYISYFESKQYKEQYPDEEITGAVIEIHFKYPITDNCRLFLNSVQNQIGENGITIEIVSS